VFYGENNIYILKNKKMSKVDVIKISKVKIPILFFKMSKNKKIYKYCKQEYLLKTSL